MIPSTKALPLLLSAWLAASSTALPAQLRRGELQSVVVHGVSLEHNRIGESADRAVLVYLPPSYASGNQRYPVIYLLHGIMDSPRTWTVPWEPANSQHAGFATIQALMDQGIASGLLREMIVVMPDADKTCHYTDSPVKGGWATFIARDLVGHIDRRYRTVAAPHGRGLMGHSMGGHGAIKIAMLFPGTFSSVYAMNPSMLGWGGDVSPSNSRLAAVGELRRLDDLARQDFYVQAVVGIGQCFAPDTAAPLLTTPIFVSEGGVTQPGPARDLWTAQMPVHMAPRYSAALRALRGLRFDSAFEDEFTHIPITTRAFSRVLDSLGVDHTFEMYNGDHRNRLWGRDGRVYNDALPFFSRLLATAAPVLTEVPATARSRAAAQEMLWQAARDGNMRRAADALAAGADVNALDTLSGESGGSRSGRRALNYAALHNQPRMVQWLAERGADVALTNRSGFTPLHHAAEKGSVHAAEALLKAGADPNAKLPSGSTPLTVAAQRRFTALVRLLEPVTRR